MLVCLLHAGSTQAATSINSGSIQAGLILDSTELSHSPHGPGHDGSDACDFVDSENNDDSQVKADPVHAFDYCFSCLHHIVADLQNTVMPFPAASGNAFRSTPVYILTERFRL